MCCLLYYVLLNMTFDDTCAPPGQLLPHHRESDPEVTRQWRGGGGERAAELWLGYLPQPFLYLDDIIVQ